MTNRTYEVVDMYCCRCKGRVDSPSSFRTPSHLRVFMMTGLCQVCQDLDARKDARLRDIERGRG